MSRVLPQQRAYFSRYLLFTLIYFVQGVIIAYSTTFFKPHMASEGIDVDRIGLVSALMLLPFIVKPFYGLVSDRVNLFGRGHRVPYMMVGVTLCAACFFVAFFVDPSVNFGLMAGLIVAIAFFMALFDATADALAVDSVPEDEHTRVQGYMTAGRAFGLILLSFVFGLLAAQFGYRFIFLVIGALLLLPLYILFQTEEPLNRTAAQTFEVAAFRQLLQVRYVMLSLLLLLAWLMFDGIQGIVTLHMVDMGAPESALGQWGSLKGVGMVIGAVGFSTFGRKIGRIASAFILLTLVSLLGFYFSTTSSYSAVLTMAIVWGIVVGLQWTVYGSVIMNVTDLRIAGSMFAIFMTMNNIGTAIGQFVGTALTDNIGFDGVFQLMAGLNLLLIPFSFFVMRQFISFDNERSAGPLNS